MGRRAKVNNRALELQAIRNATKFDEIEYKKSWNLDLPEYTSSLYMAGGKYAGRHHIIVHVVDGELKEVYCTIPHMCTTIINEDSTNSGKGFVYRADHRTPGEEKAFLSYAVPGFLYKLECALVDRMLYPVD